MKSLTLLPLLACLALAACDDDAPTPTKVTQSQKAAEAAQSISFEDNAEIDNIKHRVMLTADPGKIGFIVLLNAAGQPIVYESVKGKVTSGSKRLTPPDRVGGYTEHPYVRAAASDEGTWGTSGPYIFYWNQDGAYRQWEGGYLYSDQPIRLRVEPLVINVAPTKP